MAKKQFKAESKRMLDLMINSIYTHKEIFLRELISNASDALDKRHFQSLTNASVAVADGEEYAIRLTIDKANRKLTVEDNGCGISKEAQANLFKPFYTTKPRGTGLGLMMALKMVMLMKGNMEIKSVKNKGTRVTFFIPDGRKENAQS